MIGCESMIVRSGMLTLVIGGSASGKSEYAEQHVMSLNGARIYIATMEPFGKEAADRISKHRQMRKNKGFETIECYTGLKDVRVPPGSNVLLEDLGNLMANEIFSPAGKGPEAVRTGIEALIPACAHLTIVTNEIFSGGTDCAEETLYYMRELAAMNRHIAARADRVTEIVCGIPNILKQTK